MAAEDLPATLRWPRSIRSLVAYVPTAKAHWYSADYDTQTHRFHAVLLTEDLMVGSWELETGQLEDGTFGWTLSLTYTGLNERGNQIIGEEDFELRVRQMLEFILVSAKQYLEEGRVLEFSRGRKLGLLGAMIKANILRLFR